MLSWLLPTITHPLSILDDILAPRAPVVTLALGRAGETCRLEAGGGWTMMIWCNERRELVRHCETLHIGWNVVMLTSRSRSRRLVVAVCCGVLWGHCRPEYWSEEAADWREERGEHQGLEIMVLSLPVVASRPLHSAQWQHHSSSLLTFQGKLTRYLSELMAVIKLSC